MNKQAYQMDTELRIDLKTKIKKIESELKWSEKEELEKIIGFVIRSCYEDKKFVDEFNRLNKCNIKNSDMTFDEFVDHRNVTRSYENNKFLNFSFYCVLVPFLYREVDRL